MSFSEVYIKCVEGWGSIPGSIELFFELFSTDLNFSVNMSFISYHMSLDSYHISVYKKCQWMPKFESINRFVKGEKKGEKKGDISPFNFINGFLC